MKNLKENIKIILILSLLLYPLLYYTYKFYSPNFGGTDFYQYYLLYNEFDWKKTEAPFNMRLVSSFLVFLINKLNVYYHTNINYNHPNIKQSIFFNAIFINWLAVFFTTYLIFQHIFHKHKNLIQSLFTALLYPFSFGTILYCINPNTDGFSILLITIYYLLYKKNSSSLLWMYPLLLFQREFAFVIFGLISFFDYLYENKKYYLYHCITNFFFFIAYYFLRKTIFFTPQYSNQITESSFFYNLFEISLDLNSFIKQVFLLQNLWFLFFFLIIFNKSIQSNYKKILFLIIFTIITFIISRIAVANNNMGRFLHMFSPILIIEMIYPEMIRFIEQISKKNHSTN